MSTDNEISEYIYQTCEMGKNNLETILKNLENRDNKIKNKIEESLKGYEKYYIKSKKILQKNKIKPKSKGITNNLMSKMGIDMNIMKDNSDSKIAEMIIQGMTMGIIEMEKKVDNYEDNTDKEIIKLAKNLIKFQEENIEDFKEFL